MKSVRQTTAHHHQIAIGKPKQKPCIPTQIRHSVPMKPRLIGKLLHEIGTKVRVLLENNWKGRRRVPKSSQPAYQVLQVFTLHRNGISLTRIAVNIGLHLVR
jgi:hypothetical protein